MDSNASALVRYLATPYILTMEPVQGSDGHWTCRAEYPELEGCRAEALSPEEAVDRLESTAVTYLSNRLKVGLPIHVERAPLDYLLAEARDRVGEPSTASASTGGGSA